REDERTSALPHSRTLSLEFLGRADDQVKVRGFRIELGEIESSLAAHPAVREAAVLARTDSASGTALVAYVVPADSATQPSSAELASALRDRLPDYMVPAAWVFLDAFPLNPSGKLDRRALPAPERAGAESTQAAPRTLQEEILAGLWAQLLGLPSVGVFDDFFELGGHSLLGARLISRVREAFGVELPLRALFEVPTVAGLAGRIAAEGAAGLLEQLPLLATGATEAPLSFSQERLWFLDRLEPGSSLYNIPMVLRLTGDLDVEVLRRSFTEIVRRHGALRTTFLESGGAARQVVAPAAEVPLPVIDLSGLPAQGSGLQDREAARQIARDAHSPFDLSRGPLLRLHLFRHGRQDHTLIANVHHIVSDGWSMGVLVDEASALYEAFFQGLPSPLPELPVQFTDFALWQRAQLAGPRLETQLDYWRHELAGAPTLLDLPTDRPRPAVQSSRGATLSVHMPAAAAAGVHTLARQAGATPFMVLLAVFQTLLHRDAGVDDVLVGSPTSNRNRVEVEELIGFFVNTQVFRLRLRAGDGFLALVERVRATTLAGHAHQDVPFELLVDAVGVERSLAYNPLFQVMLELQNVPAGELRATGLTFAPVAPPITTAKFDLTLSLLEAAGALTAEIEYATDLFDAPTVARFGGHFRNLLQAAIDQPGQRVDLLPVMAAAERHQVLLGWNDTEVALDLGQPFIDLFASQVARRPEAPAVTDGFATLSYAELDRRADRLGRDLRARGAGPEFLVALLDDRGIDLLTAILAVFKAGAAYLPLDPAHPAPRIRQVLVQSGAHLVLSGERHLPVLEEALGEMERPPGVRPI
ncbi:MAG TPA: condensation domain-containing protein, partial [Thermoanaerobaculia bacterium]|nr:condensation domain-containing protein [Thermoanaerobaculia bacterium]